jgi:DNA polymerase III subunit gamma/tau
VEYQALYRKYRPQTFDDVIGQSHVTSTLAREVAEGHVAHAYLFAGPRGTGKTTTARILAKALNCEDRGPDGSPCNVCGSCVAVTEGSSLDVMELDAASHNSVDDIREMRVSVTTVASASGAKRVFILDEAHMLSKAAGNALLKTLEEPPEGVHFVLATTEPYKLLDTIRSRSQRFDFHAISIEALAAHLSRISDAEGFKTDPAALMSVARHALGSARDSLSLLEQVAALGNGVVDPIGVSRALGLADGDAFNTLVEAVKTQDARSALELVARLASEGADLRRFVAESVGFFRGVFLAHYAPNLAEIADEPAEVLNSWKMASASLPSADVLRAVDILGDALIKLREGREERLMLELAMIRLTRPETSFDAGAIQSRLDRLERRLAGQPMPTSPTPSVSPPAQPPVTSPAQPPGEQHEMDVSPPLRVVPSTSEPAEQQPAAHQPEAPVAPAAAEAAFETMDIAQAAAPLVAEDAAPPARSKVNPTMAQFEQIWPALFAGLRDLLGSRRWALFRETEPGAVEGSTLVVAVKHDFHLKALKDDNAVAMIVSTRAGDLLGGDVRVVFRGPGESGGGAAPVADTGMEEDLSSIEFQPDRLIEAPPDLTDPFKLITEELGGTVVDEYEVESSDD